LLIHGCECAFYSTIATAAALLAAPVHAAPNAAHEKANTPDPGRRPAPGKVALTFDDLPGLSLFTDQAYVDYFNAMLLRGLKKHHPAIGFVNEVKLTQGNREHQVANLTAWLNAGMDLGNHTYSHESPNEIGASAYTADIAKGEHGDPPAGRSTARPCAISAIPIWRPARPAR
jgi:peptidoglycan/xylan/chitin deacetylase (PgdA/CDA1 family)